MLAADLEELDRTDSVIVTSFSSDVMIAFEFAPDVATSPGEDEMVAWYLGTGGITEQDVLAQLPPERLGIDILDPELIARIQAEGIELWIWPNSDDQENEAFTGRCLSLGSTVSSPACRPKESPPLSAERAARSSLPDVFVPEIGLGGDELGHQRHTVGVVSVDEFDAARQGEPPPRGRSRFRRSRSAGCRRAAPRPCTCRMGRGWCRG